MKISVEINAPDGEFCKGCDLWWRSEDKKRCYCLLFGMVELNQRYRENVTGTDIVKCEQCKAAMGCRPIIYAEWRESHDKG